MNKIQNFVEKYPQALTLFKMRNEEFLKDLEFLIYDEDRLNKNNISLLHKLVDWRLIFDEKENNKIVVSDYKGNIYENQRSNSKTSCDFSNHVLFSNHHMQ